MDKCEVCKGHRGGVPGNENLYQGVVVCDYCHATILKFLEMKKQAEDRVRTK